MIKERKNAFLRGTVLLSLSVVLTKLVGVLFKVPLSYVIGDEGMGYFNTAYAIYGFFYILCTAGVPKSVTLAIAKTNLKDDENDMDILRVGLGLFFKIGLISTLFNIICAPVFAKLIGNSGAVYSIVAVAPSIVFVSMCGVLRGYLNGRESFTGIAISQVIEAVVKLCIGLSLALVGVRLKQSVRIVSALAILGITVGSIISFAYMMIVVFILKKDKKTRQKYYLSKRYYQKEILKNALPIALSSSLLNLSSTLDLVMIIKRLTFIGMSEIEANSIYGNYTTLAIPMFNLVISVLTPIATSYMPRLSRSNCAGDTKSFAENLNRLVFISLFISVPASISLYYYSFDLLDVLFSVQSSAIGADMLACLSLGLCFLTLLTVYNTALESCGKINVAVASLIIGCVIKGCVSYFMIGASDFGILGAPIGTVISYIISLAISVFALEIHGVKTFAISRLLLYSFIGILSFRLPYNYIYKESLLGSSFYSMILALLVSLITYAVSIALSIIFFKRFGIFKMHKKHSLILGERTKIQKSPVNERHTIELNN